MKKNRIKDEAAQRVIELEKAKDPNAYRAELERWFNEDTGNRAAFESMQQAWKAVDDLKILHIRSVARSAAKARRLWNHPLLPFCAAAASLFVIACTYLMDFFAIYLYLGAGFMVLEVCLSYFFQREQFIVSLGRTREHLRDADPLVACVLIMAIIVVAWLIWPGYFAGILFNSIRKSSR